MDESKPLCEGLMLEDGAAPQDVLAEYIRGWFRGVRAAANESGAGGKGGSRVGGRASQPKSAQLKPFRP